LNNLASRLPSLTTLLWIVASLVAFGAFLFIAPNLLTPPSPTPTSTGIALTVATPSPTQTLITTPTPLPLAPPANTRVVEPSPPIPPDTKLYSFIADPTRSGYLKQGEEKAHWGDRNLHAGFFGGDPYSSILFFDISELPPNSEIVSAELEVTGLSRDNLGAQGEWRASLIRVPPFEDWEAVTPQQLLNATSTSTIGETLGPADLELGQANLFRFTAEQLPALTNDVGERNYLVVRLEGPTTAPNSLFTWDGGGLDLKTGAHPVLRIIARPGNFIIVTNTPTAENVVTTAALAVQATNLATRVGTATPFPRTYATATPIVLVTRVPTPENVGTRVAIAQVATAVAITTGTYTPTPENWIVVTPTFTRLPTSTPTVIPLETMYARLTETVAPTGTATILEMIQTPVPSFLKGNILIKTDRFNGDDVAVMKPDGTLLQALPSDAFYNIAFAHESFSPDRRSRAIVAEDPNRMLQIWIEDVATGNRTPVTHFEHGITYDPAWSPDGGSIAFVSRETGHDEIYVYDLGNQNYRQITHGGNPFIYKQRPTWSPDSKQIAFKANDGTLNFQIWIMDSDGSNLRNVSQSAFNDYDPVWVK